LNVVNVHQRLLHAAPERVGALIDTLASPADRLWPHGTWPRLRLDGPLAVGAAGGHGPIRYQVSDYVPGQLVRFRFTAPRGFDGWHQLEVLDATAAHCVLEHRIEMRLRGFALLSWPLMVRPLHDALLEDALTQAEAALGLPLHERPWSPVVRAWRALLAPGAARRLVAARRRHAG
jgi:hypothetical protein